MPRGGFSHRQLQRDNTWLSARLAQMGPYITGLFPPGIEDRRIVKLDISCQSPKINELDDPDKFVTYIEEQILLVSADIAVSSCGEKRIHPLLGKEMLHLGIDAWILDDLPVQVPINGTLYTVQGDGAGIEVKIVIQHHLGALRYYTIFSHIDAKTMTTRTTGAHLNAGELLGYPTHYGPGHRNLSYFHFLIILEANEAPFEVPEYVDLQYSDYFLALCPDPGILAVNNTHSCLLPDSSINRPGRSRQPD